MPITQITQLPTLRDNQLFSVLSADELRQILQTRQVSSRYRRLNFYALVLVTAGTVRCQYEFELHEKGAGSLQLFKPQRIIALDSLSDWQGWIITFSTAMLGNEPLLDEFLAWQGQLQLSDADHAQLVPLAQALQHSQTQANSPILANVQRHLLWAILGQILYFSSQSTPKISQLSKEQQRFLAFCDLLERHFCEQHQSQAYAELLHCTEKTLRLTCLNATGFTPKSLINQRLILESKRLLAFSTLNINQIAETLGFDESTNFNKFFKKEMGQSAKQWRVGFGSGV
ncbi:helix-turn-helix transcriptional regulator [Lonepinella sp. BR2882]|uniref:helix-turn-helix transcriptional regulator n=1 Tax=Lonepinella sp. BR2882 TaxID=3095283 RepID=UPI003F6DDFC9